MDASTFDDPDRPDGPDRAARHLSAALVEREFPGRLRKAQFYIGSALAAIASADPPASHDLVVTRIATGREVMRTRANVLEPGLLLDQVREDLESKSVREFFIEWKLPEELGE